MGELPSLQNLYTLNEKPRKENKCIVKDEYRDNR